jgi:hypothetical protein
MHVDVGRAACLPAKLEDGRHTGPGAALVLQVLASWVLWRRGILRPQVYFTTIECLKCKMYNKKAEEKLYRINLNGGWTEVTYLV